jgi:hypothetical protein
MSGTGPQINEEGLIGRRIPPLGDPTRRMIGEVAAKNIVGIIGRVARSIPSIDMLAG